MIRKGLWLRVEFGPGEFAYYPAERDQILGPHEPDGLVPGIGVWTGEGWAYFESLDAAEAAGAIRRVCQPGDGCAHQPEGAEDGAD